MNFIVCKKKGPHGLVLIVTDDNLLGHYFEEGKRQLDLCSKFYTGEQKTKEEVKQLLKVVRHGIFTGKNAVALAIELDLIDPKRILFVQNVPHAQVVIE